MERIREREDRKAAVSASGRAGKGDKKGKGRKPAQEVN